MRPVQIPAGGGSREADESGAIATLAGQPFGTVALWLMLVGFAALALWQLTEATVGSGGTTERVESAGRTAFYAVLVVSLANLLLAGSGPESGDQHARDLTAKALQLPAGQLLVGVAGLAVLGLGLYWIHKGVTRGFRDDLRTGGMSPRARTAVTALGVAGYVARGVIAGLAAVFLVRAPSRTSRSRPRAWTPRCGRSRTPPPARGCSPSSRSACWRSRCTASRRRAGAGCDPSGVIRQPNGLPKATVCRHTSRSANVGITRLCYAPPAIPPRRTGAR